MSVVANMPYNEGNPQRNPPHNHIAQMCVAVNCVANSLPRGDEREAQLRGEMSICLQKIVSLTLLEG